MRAVPPDRQSAGILAFRSVGSSLCVLLVHPGGPFWAKKDEGAWSIPKGLLEQGEDSLSAARREFEEETGFIVDGSFVSLGELRQPSGKTVHAWAIETDFDVSRLRSNAFTMEWPPHSGTVAEFPEVDRGAWFAIDDAFAKISKGQRGFLERLVTMVGTVLQGE
jgi:predicted NUDIX family NTP pyrophosphohydrolase